MKVNKLPHILILCYEYPPLGGGAGVVARHQAEGLAKTGKYEITVLSTWFEGEEEIEQKSNQLRIVRVKSKRKHIHQSNPIEMMSWAKKAWDFLKNDPINYTLSFGHFSIPSSIPAKKLLKQNNVPYVVISHGQDIPWFFPKQMLKYHLITYFWVKSIIRPALKLVLLTEKMKQNADRFMGKHKHKNLIIPNGCNTDFFKPSFSQKSKHFKIIFVGRIVAQKGPLIFMKAVQEVIKRLPTIDLEIKIIGDGPMRKDMEAFIQKHQLQQHITTTGWIPKEKLLLEYQSASMQLITSYDEAMSIAALESLSTGLFVVSTPVSGSTDLIQTGETGAFFGFGKWEEAADRIVEFYQEKFLKGWQVDGEKLEAFREEYDWESIVGRYEELIQHSLNQ